MEDSKIVIIAPANSITGGPHLLHQLCWALGKIKKNSAVCYLPFDEVHTTPEPYKIYNVDIITAKEIHQRDTIILSEYNTKLVKNFAGNQIYIWWLSVDNFYRFKTNNFLVNLYKYFFGPFIFREGFKNLRKYHHLAQSHYAISFLNKKRINAEYLSDFLSKEHFTQPSSCKKENIVAYNPKKIPKNILDFVKTLRNIQFIPIENMSSNEVAELLSKAKIYIDFGRNPGKDRIPREAAMAECVLIVGRRGSANFDLDVPIHSMYKLSFNKLFLKHKLSRIINEVINNYSYHNENFHSYRNVIKKEEEIFLKNVNQIFGNHK